ncbi:phospholipase [Halobacteriales archaeon QS_8_69_26]|nr:MAG: phospholipase [Halobacteriales archaeon QS_8_69_26]
MVAVYPNPHARGDRGEFVVLSVPDGTDLSGVILDDGEDRVALPNTTAGGRAAVTPDPARARNLTDAAVVGVDALELSNAGERIRLRHDGVVVDAVAYEDAPEGELRRQAGATGDEWEWWPLAGTDRAPADLPARAATAFVLPDAPAITVETLRSADRRILLAGYTLTSPRVVRALRAAADRGVRVRVLVDSAPVGGMDRRQGEALNALVEVGVDVRVFGGERAPYRFHHAKYAVVDDRALVLTENFKPAGTGGRSSRGWGAVVEGPAVARELAAVFRADTRESTSIPWREYRRNASFVEGDPANGSYPSRFDPRRVPLDGVRVLVAPDNAERGLVRVLCGAEESILVQQMTVEPGPLLWATMAAARRGVRVRVLASGARYVRGDNRRTVRRLNRWADREGVDLRAKVADPRSRFEKVHAKGVVVDGDRAVVSSVNWNTHSPRENREVAVVLEGDRAGSYFARVFRADWRDGAWRLPAGVVGLVVLTVGTAVAVARRRIRFAAT